MKNLITICCMCVVIGTSYASNPEARPYDSDGHYTRLKVGTPEFQKHKRDILEDFIKQTAPCSPRTRNQKIQSVLDKCGEDEPSSDSSDFCPYVHSLFEVKYGKQENKILEALRNE